MRKMTPLLAKMYDLAKRVNLSFPLGRAAAMVNRFYNDGRGNLGWTEEEWIAHMRTFQISTARKWRDHWLGNGSLKKLGMTREEQLAERRVKDRERRRDRKDVR